MKKSLFWILIFMPSVVFSASKGDVIINEIMYNPAGADNRHEWIELYNTTSYPVDLSKWKLWENSTNHSLRSPLDNPVIPAKGYALIVQDRSIFLEDHSCGISPSEYTVLESVFNLTNSDEPIGLKDEHGRMISSLQYKNTWNKNLENRSIERINPSGSDNEGLNWKESAETGGTPGQRNSATEYIYIYVLFRDKSEDGGIHFDRKNPPDPDGGYIGAWSSLEQSGIRLSKVDQDGDYTEGNSSLRADLEAGSLPSEDGGGWWIQFGYDGKTNPKTEKDMSEFTGGYLKFDIKTDNEILVKIEWGQDGSSGKNTVLDLGIPADNKWHQVSVPFASFTGIDMKRITVPAGFHTIKGRVPVSYLVDNIRWEK